ncbi:MAG: DUF1552 domain-containing protein [Myxococcaceae bacterium]|nr:DUF1552 domain-containing protein [Myxococcaceae bacterium]
MTLKLDRRTLLKGATASLALPSLEAMFDGRGRLYAGASGQTVEPPRYFAAFHWPYGLPQPVSGSNAALADFWFPQKRDLTTNVEPLTGTPEGLAPLFEQGPYGNFRQDVNVVSGLTLRNIGEHLVGSHGHATETFTGYRAVLDPVHCCEPMGAARSVDNVASFALTGRPSLYIKLDANDYWEWSTVNAFSRNVVYRRPAALFDALFGGGTPGADDAAKARELARKRSIVDQVKRDADRLKQRLGRADQARLAEHLETVRLLEQGIAAQPMGPAPACSVPVRPDDATYGPWQVGAGGAARPADPKSSYAGFDAYTHLMIDLATLAMACGRVQSVLFSIGGSQNDGGRFEHVTGPAPYSVHNIQHGAGTGTPEGVGQMKRIVQWQMAKVAYFLSRLKALGAGTPGGSLLQNSTFVALSEFYTGHHVNNFLPVLVAGQARPMVTGQHVAFKNHYHQAYGPNDPYPNWSELPTWTRALPAVPNNRVFGNVLGMEQSAVCLNDLWQSALEATGAYRSGEKFGDPALWSARRLPHLWA